jgi:hypothetical protein
MEITILAGSTAKIPFHRIPGINWILVDSDRYTWRTVKNLGLHRDEMASLHVVGLGISELTKSWGGGDQ